MKHLLGSFVTEDVYDLPKLHQVCALQVVLQFLCRPTEAEGRTELVRTTTRIPKHYSQQNTVHTLTKPKIITAAFFSKDHFLNKHQPFYIQVFFQESIMNEGHKVFLFLHQERPYFMGFLRRANHCDISCSNYVQSTSAFQESFEHFKLK